ncbi:MAG: hypothetical protein EAZ76_07570 [Nostocales cyanobacterium]|nr:MAG: hypothetical protein EAZ87_21855 [Nostocales cyanobacterium]TAF16369.1 MAG: hypothetical protein EAZ76_07570 [Nostocales cyanobacterium]
MSKHNDDLKNISAQILAAMLSNPHIYSQVSDEGGDGNMEQKLVMTSVEIAESLIECIVGNHRHREIEITSRISSLKT